MLNKTMLAAAVTVMLAACGGGGDDPVASTPTTPSAPTTVAVGDTVALTGSGKLVSFNRATPGTLVGAIPVSGLASGESLVGIDSRPADAALYGISSAGRIYTLNPATGVATLKTTLKAAAGDDNPYTALTGTEFAVDFNPVADRLRVVSNTGLNLRINVDTGDTITDGTITPPAGTTAVVTAGAYTNSFAGATTTVLYDIDAAAGLLYVQDPPNNGGLATPVPLGVTGTAVNGFDIDARGNTGYAVITTGSTTALYTVNLGATTAAATRVGEINAAEPLRGLALVQPSSPTVVGLTDNNRIVSFDPKAPNTLTANTALTGMPDGEIVIGIDVRPADRMMYALTNTGKLFTVNVDTGATTLKSTLVADAADTTAPYTALVGNSFSVDFNPVADRLRVISDLGQSLRINVDTGATTTDGDINRAGVAPRVLGAAYTNSFAGTTSTVLFDLDGNSDVLARQDPPNNGTLVNIGNLGLDINTQVAFDIAGGANGLPLVALRTGATGPFSLYTVSLTTGALSLYRNTGDAALSRIGGANGPTLRDIAIRF